MSVTESTAGAPLLLVDQVGEIDLVVGRRFLVGRRGAAAAGIGVEAVVRHRLELHLAAELPRQRGADVVGFLLEARHRDVVLRARHPEGDDAAVDRERLRLAHRGARRRRAARAGSRPTPR